MTADGRIDVVLVCGGQWHDFEFARRELLTVLGRHERVRVSVHADYEFGDVLDRADALVTYTCNVLPSPTQQQRLADFVAGGGRWLALHATNSVLQPPEPGAERVFRTPAVSGPMFPVLGSHFLAHPPMQPFTVEVSAPDHPLVEGIERFDVCDELYVSELYPPLEVLLHARFSGPCPSFELGRTTDDEPRPVLYLKDHGSGQVCYLTLGHCRGRHDLQDLGIDDLGRIDLGPWAVPEFQILLGRVVEWVLPRRVGAGSSLR